MAGGDLDGCCICGGGVIRATQWGWLESIIGPGAGPGVKGTRPYKRDISFRGVYFRSMPALRNMRSEGK